MSQGTIRTTLRTRCPALAQTGPMGAGRGPEPAAPAIQGPVPGGTGR